ncbi:uncharacterized protein BDZ99DRAFT_468197 [Mytilinidion resinicola]|uniref:Retrotransposon gag domain-containing protein n=1 Tax=Mytilinidion resinicola TaxID=574789 RepID=A0A6A6Y4W5_9PEZI|nr:uncharacterized protein BDZ99DRAFT_468197 [Mytilinidion resinicola]KAF2803669.1 hypothetical protein BDZ99DRAFT_468197 [Mytilinidion resinicola]
MNTLMTVPTFNGEPGEDLAQFLRRLRLRLTPLLRHYTDEEDRRELKLMDLIDHLGGEAKKHYENATSETENDFNLLCKSLEDWMQNKQDNGDVERAIEDFLHLSQGEKSMEEYIRYAKKIHNALHKVPEMSNAVVKEVKSEQVRDIAGAILSLQQSFNFKEAAKVLLSCDSGSIITNF